ncbi:VOC family protein [Undibacterium sp. Jales W-56]|uniref:VOC family protein n=1 Tax=Undibacterium sp. Jales W-56 TaxID=2897325 RepID=UPI0021CE125E|nr:VOC family protein [Undibacterium sp. Jales W-56]MCU6434672.1 VOC family protein [Undibacterium sp. Jales W-56]
MPHPNFILLYVDNPLASAQFYRDILGLTAIETSPTFAMFALDSGIMLGLWSKHTVVPAPAHPQIGGTSEIAFALETNAQVDQTYRDWKERHLPVIQEPATVDFDYTFVATDPDGHRLRVFAASH